jgi:transportin-1
MLFPRLIESFDSSNSKIRAYSINSINQFVLIHCEVLFKYLDHYLEGLFKNASHESYSVRQSVCQAFVMLLEVRPDRLLLCMDQLVDYMLFSTQDDNQDVALEACEFWLAFAEQENLKDNLRPYINK